MIISYNMVVDRKDHVQCLMILVQTVCKSYQQTALVGKVCAVIIKITHHRNL